MATARLLQAFAQKGGTHAPMNKKNLRCYPVVSPVNFSTVVYFFVLIIVVNWTPVYEQAVYRKYTYDPNFQYRTVQHFSGGITHHQIRNQFVERKKEKNSGIGKYSVISFFPTIALIIIKIIIIIIMPFINKKKSKRIERAAAMGQNNKKSDRKSVV